MQTTITIDDQILAAAEKRAASTGRTLNAVIEDALREVLATPSREQSARPVPLPSFKGSRVQPGVDLSKSAELLDLMDGVTR